MFAGSEILSMAAFLLVFLGMSAAAYFLFWRSYGDDARALARLRDLSSEGQPMAARSGVRDWARSALPRLGAQLLPGRVERIARLRADLTRTGVYEPSAVNVYWGAKLAAMAVFSMLSGLAPFLCGVLSLPWALFASTLACAAGLLAPSVWLRWRVSRRQRELRLALPDFLDMLVLCLEGGMSLTAALPRVIGEMVQVHATLGEELAIAQQTANLGLSVGDAFKQFGERCGLSEVKDLASVVLQSERFGASLVKTLRTHADAYRVERQQQAEEMAQKASVKILFPMLLFIFPAIFVVLLGPAAFQMAQIFSK
jgi:tight adherence protein C